jgi:hypothetical protein
VLNDEALLLGAAFSLADHGRFDQCVGIFEDGRFEPVSPCWFDKRPLLFPLLVAGLHAGLGNRPENGFAVNAAAGLLALAVFQALLRRWLPAPLPALGALLLAAFPIFALSVASAGFEVVNLLCALVVFLLLDRFLESDDVRDAERLALAGVLLAQARYESLGIAACAGGVALARMRARHWRALSWRAPLVPLLLLPVAWQRLAADVADHAWTPPAEAPFAVAWLWHNLASAWRFFAAGEPAGEALPAVFGLALLGIPLAGLALARRRADARARSLALAAGLALALQAGVSFAYYWGDLTHPSSMRLGVVFLPAIVALALAPLHAVVADSRWRGRAALAAALALLPFSWATARRDASLGARPLAREYRAVLGLLEARYAEAHALVVSSRPVLFTPQLRSAVPFRLANREPQRLLEGLRAGRFDEILVVQRVSPAGEASPQTRLDPAFRLEPQLELELAPGERSRISRVLVR